MIYIFNVKRNRNLWVQCHFFYLSASVCESPASPHLRGQEPVDP